MRTVCTQPLPQEVRTTSCAALRYRIAGSRPQEVTACPATEDCDQTPFGPEPLPSESGSARAHMFRAVMP